MADGTFLLHGTPPTPVPLKAPDDWSPYCNGIEFEAAEFAFKRCHMSARNLDFLYATQLGDVLWQCFSAQYTGERPKVVPPWMDEEFEDTILQDPETHGSALIPIILSSDKTTVSVGTGNNEYYPLYASIGNICNNVRHAHRDALVIIGFLAIPKTDKMHSKDDLFRIFHHQLFHSSLSVILSSLKPVMTEYEVVRCGDGHFWRIIYSLGPYITDYEEQLVLSCIVKHWCLKCIGVHTNLDADIHELLSFDLLHQLIKGAFKDHLVDWVAKYLKAVHRTKQLEEIMSDIDRRVAAVPSFSGLQHFPQGHDFKQWTGDDSKVLMKVFLPAIEGHVPQDMVRVFHALLEFCYLVWHNVITKDTLIQIQDALGRFHQYHTIFENIVPTFSLPHQHLMVHYVNMIRLFGAPNGLCSSITESKHIKAIKEPWWWSNRHNALGQMLVTNQYLDKLTASHADCDARGMLTGTILSSTLAALVTALAHEVALNPDDAHNPKDIPAASLPRHEGKLQVFNSAAAMFYAPSDLSGIGGMRCKHIHACPLWRNEYPRNDCMFINTDSDAEGIVICFFSFKHNWEWFEKIGDCPDEDTGMWMVAPSFHEDGSRNLAVIHIETVFHAAHLIAIYGSEYIPHSLKFYHSLDIFGSFYVNKYADHHAFEIVS
ncbi:uncharacterized protein BJ212DRAFT_1450497 [Suillus subaureus]|uniref:Fungal-type protein kinase domain-containing protein n=1 Tax=Suillus subaureus TaxID=48587 RepID=A0A9P7IY53_9AGAM|nr:uncharacterized protein BJ212DRAFT_1450497 [Suillus subaureus]KAG1797296.1 hypothetical protein BJ212DRAFT_1450497 [Suillus subaureus]